MGAIIDWLKDQGEGLLVGATAGSLATHYGTKMLKEKLKETGRELGKSIAEGMKYSEMEERYKTLEEEVIQVRKELEKYKGKQNGTG